MSFGHYQTLGVSSAATRAELRQAYLRLARQHHPDLNPQDGQAVERFQRIQVAYELLSDPERRRQYDRAPHLSTQRPVVHAAPTSTAAPFKTVHVTAPPFSRPPNAASTWQHWRPEKQARRPFTAWGTPLFLGLSGVLLVTLLSSTLREGAVTLVAKWLPPARNVPRQRLTPRTPVPEGREHRVNQRERHRAHDPAPSHVTTLQRNDQDSQPPSATVAAEVDRGESTEPRPPIQPPALAGLQALLAGQSLFAPQELSDLAIWEPDYAWEETLRVDPFLVTGRWSGRNKQAAGALHREFQAATVAPDATAWMVSDSELAGTGGAHETALSRTPQLPSRPVESTDEDKSHAHWKRFQQLAYHPADSTPRDQAAATEHAVWRRVGSGDLRPLSATGSDPVRWPPPAVVPEAQRSASTPRVSGMGGSSWSPDAHPQNSVPARRNPAVSPLSWAGAMLASRAGSSAAAHGVGTKVAVPAAARGMATVAVASAQQEPSAVIPWMAVDYASQKNVRAKSALSTPLQADVPAAGRAKIGNAAPTVPQFLPFAAGPNWAPPRATGLRAEW